MATYATRPTTSGGKPERRFSPKTSRWSASAAQIGNWASPDHDLIFKSTWMKFGAWRLACSRQARSSSASCLIPNDEKSPLSQEAWKAEVFRRLKELTAIAEGEGIVLAHENCNGYGATAEGYLEMVEAVGSSALQLIMDTGNNSLHDNDVEVTWNYYDACRAEVTHVHVKCAKPGVDGGGHVTCPCGRGSRPTKNIRRSRSQWIRRLALHRAPHQGRHPCGPRRRRLGPRLA